jgi:hypothetical protein
MFKRWRRHFDVNIYVHLQRFFLRRRTGKLCFYIQHRTKIKLAIDITVKKKRLILYVIYVCTKLIEHSLDIE